MSIYKTNEYETALYPGVHQNHENLSFNLGVMAKGMNISSSRDCAAKLTFCCCLRKLMILILIETLGFSDSSSPYFFNKRVFLMLSQSHIIWDADFRLVCFAF